MSEQPTNPGPGRPSEYSEELVRAICLRIADGESLRSICRDESMPGRSTVFDWLDEHADFRTKYARARELQADALFDDMLEIADDGSADYKLAGRDGDQLVIDTEAVQRSRLRVATRQWQAEKLAPKKYGPRVALDHGGEVAVKGGGISGLLAAVTNGANSEDSATPDES